MPPAADRASPADAARSRSAADQRAFAAALANAGAAPLDGLHDGRGGPAGHRIRLYRDSLAATRRAALRATFPATATLMGATHFVAAADAYAARHAPRSPLLFEYGADFPDFIATLPGLAPYPFVPEAARIEFARLGASHAADGEPLSAAALTSIPPGCLGATVLVPHPATALVPLAAGGLAAWQRCQMPPRPQTPAAACLVTRPRETVRVTALNAAAGRFVARLLAGEPLGRAAVTPHLDLSAALALVLRAGAFASLARGTPAR